MSEAKTDINVTELLIQISKDVSSIKTDMANIKESQKADKENTAREISDVRDDYHRDLTDLENKVMGKLNNLQAVQNNLVGDVDTLKHAEEQKDAKRWRTVITYLMTGLGGIVIARLPDFLSFLFSLSQNGGK